MIVEISSIVYRVYLSNMQITMVHSNLENLLILINWTASANITVHITRDPKNRSCKKIFHTFYFSFSYASVSGSLRSTCGSVILINNYYK